MNVELRGLIHKKKMCSRGGSNSRPSDYETDALPTELLKHYFLFQPRNNTRPVEKYRLSNIQLFLLFPLVNSRWRNITERKTKEKGKKRYHHQLARSQRFRARFMALWGRSAYRQKTVTSRLTKHRHTSPLNLLNFFIFFSLHLCALF